MRERARHVSFGLETCLTLQPESDSLNRLECHVGVRNLSVGGVCGPYLRTYCARGLSYFAKYCGVPVSGNEPLSVSSSYFPFGNNIYIYIYSHSRHSDYGGGGIEVSFQM